MLITSKQRINKFRLMRLIHYIKLYVHTCYERTWREDRSLTSAFQLSTWVLYYQDPITFCTSIIESFEGNCSLPIISVMEKPKQNLP